jgi:hypothetical protein
VGNRYPDASGAGGLEAAHKELKPALNDQDCLERFEIPRLRALARHSIPHLIEATLVPLMLFYGFLWGVGLWGAILAALAWTYVALLRRLVTRQRVPGLLLLAALGATARTVLALASGSAFVYFLQPALLTGVVGGAFLLSVVAGRPLARRLADDFVVLPPSFVGHPAIRRVFAQITVIWAMVNLINAGGAIALLVSQSVGTYFAAKTGLTWAMTIGGVAASTWWFKRVVQRQPVAVTVAA